MKNLDRFYPSISVSGALLYAFFVTLETSSKVNLAATITLYGMYMIMVWLTIWVTSIWKNIVIFTVLYIATLVCWLALDQKTTVLVLVGFLVAYISLKLPPPLSTVGVSLITVITFFLIYSVENESLSTAAEALFTYAGLYAILRLARLRRLRAKEQQQHNEELQAMNLRLADAHNKLQAAHSELEQATVRSMRYVLLEERNRIARDIHDSIGHQLTSAIVQLQALPYVMKTNEQESEQIVKNVLEVARQCLQEVRGVVHEMGNDIAGTGLVSLRGLIQQAAANSSLNIELKVLHSDEKDVWTTKMSVVLYRCLQEALTNIIRHADANKAVVTIEQLEEEVCMTVSDDGNFAGGSGWSEGFGLTSMKARCQQVGGSCEIQALVPHGMKISIRLPIGQE